MDHMTMTRKWMSKGFGESRRPALEGWGMGSAGKAISGRSQGRRGEGDGSRVERSCRLAELRTEPGRPRQTLRLRWTPMVLYHPNSQRRKCRSESLLPHVVYPHL